MTTLVFEPSQTTHWKNLFPAKTMLLGSHNLNQGEELIATIKSVSTEIIRDQNGKEEKVPVVKFDSAPPMVLNITNSRTIASLYGEQYDNWIGCAVQIYATKVRSFGSEVMALRIREAKPNIPTDNTAHEKALRACNTLDELKEVFTRLPAHTRTQLTSLKDELKGNLNAPH